ncbi:uncharacterized protein LOC127913103 [Oncorhynchus keta]|uniref:uncharacterized protein LOC127913103 n=1 Tax=Oncorhynchus keta TaxID=8018 RepID=UPI00227D68CA|nr:uncharacterized protein LOC127913103 [Oncorhynchus keta]
MVGVPKRPEPGPAPSHPQLQQLSQVQLAQLQQHGVQCVQGPGPVLSQGHGGCYTNMGVTMGVGCPTPPLSPHPPRSPGPAPLTLYHTYSTHGRGRGGGGAKLPLTLSHSQPHPHAHTHAPHRTALTHNHSPHPGLSLSPHPGLSLSPHPAQHPKHQTHFIFAAPPPQTPVARHIPQAAAHGQYHPQYPPLSSIPPPPTHSPLPPPSSPNTPLTPISPYTHPLQHQGGQQGSGGGNSSTGTGSTTSSKSKPINRISTVV